MYDEYRAVCEICKKGPKENVAIYRTGEKGPGKDPHWRCSEDLPETYNVDQEVLTVVATIESVDKVKH